MQDRNFDTSNYSNIISACKSLSVLKLSLREVPDLCGFSNLTLLELHNVSISWDIAFGEELQYCDFGEELTNCPKLHTLSLIECQFKDINISNACQKKLTIQWCKAKSALLCAPGLLSLDLEVDCRYFESFSARELPSLFSASFYIWECKNVAFLREILGRLEFAH
jgi:hypothetical protein